MRLLLVEDEIDLADTLADGLRREGYLVDVARDGASALTAAASNDVDVIVLDRDLPVLSGDAVCRTLIAQDYPARILMLTAAGTPNDVVEGAGLGVQQVEPRQMHVDDESLERPGLRRVVVEPYGQARLLDARVERRLPP